MGLKFSTHLGANDEQRILTHVGRMLSSCVQIEVNNVVSELLNCLDALVQILKNPPPMQPITNTYISRPFPLLTPPPTPTFSPDDGRFKASTQTSLPSCPLASNPEVLLLPKIADCKHASFRPFLPPSSRSLCSFDPRAHNRNFVLFPTRRSGTLDPPLGSTRLKILEVIHELVKLRSLVAEEVLRTSRFHLPLNCATLFP